ncbi:hypothetical protein SDC9_90253 [bioreactor metagenome]|uniref:Uncharacterized protein n=1 Tax=bioreactor metagenome TaxID=1076179 RepID=A0A644ZS44_9ZZZZ
MHGNREAEEFQKLGSADYLVRPEHHLGGDILDIGKQGLLAFKVPSPLVIIGKDGVYANVQRPTVRLDLVAQEVEQGGFTAAVGSYHPDFHPFGKGKGEILDDLLAIIALAKMFCFQYFLSQPAACTGETSLCFITNLVLACQQELNTIFSSTILAGTGFRPTLEPLKLPSENGVDSILFFLKTFKTLFPSFKVSGERTRMQEDRSAVHLQDCRADSIQKVAIVSYQNNGSPAVSQIVFQPFDGLDIKVVGRLIKKEEGGLAAQDAGKRYLLLHSSRKRIHALVFKAVEPKFAQEGSIVILEVPAVGGFHSL